MLFKLVQICKPSTWQKYSTWGRFSGVTECVVDVGRWVSPGARDSRKDIQIVAEPAESVSQNQPFEEWLKEDEIAKRVVLALAKSGRYNKDNRNIDSRWKEAFIEGSEKISGKPKVTTSREAAAIQKVRKKCTSKGWNFERVYKILVPHGDLDDFAAQKRQNIVTQLRNHQSDSTHSSQLLQR
eukprot:jgi/Picre1/27579/NNA_000545.t1